MWLHVALLVVASGCVRFGYDHVRSESHAPRDAGGPLHRDSGTPAIDAGDRDPMDAGREDHRNTVDADISDAGDGGGDTEAGVTRDAGSLGDAGSVTDADIPNDAGNVSDAADGNDAGTDAAAADGGDADTTCPGTTNACGGCTTLPAAPDSACGTCGLGQYACDGTDALACAGDTTMPGTSGGASPLDDFEDGDSLFRANAISGNWYVVTDGTIGVISPAVDAPLAFTSPGANGSTRALHVSGNGFSDWGAGVQGLLNLNGCYVSAAAQTGIRFYARGTGTVLLSVATRQTVPTSDGGNCLTGCYDNFAASVQLFSFWRSFSIPWSALAQNGWGTPTFFQPSQLKYIQFSFAAGSSMNLYLDDVSFY